MRERFYADLPRHFIFNGLNSIIALCRIDPEKASRLTMALAQCLNYTSVQSQTVPIDEELDAVNAFLYVQSVRFAPRFSYTVNSFKTHTYIRKYDVFNCIDDCVRKAIAGYGDNICLSSDFLQKNGQLFIEIKINGNTVLQNPIKTSK